MLVGLYDGWLEADADDSVRSIVFTGAGGSFCSGMDLKALAGNGMAGEEYRDRLKADPDLHWKAMLRHHRPRKPVIAAVEGYCVAGGTEMLQGTDIRVAGESATFGLFEVKRGLFPIGGSTVRLQRQIPRTHALEMLLTGRPYSAREAAGIGLVGHVVPDGTALDEGTGDRRTDQLLRPAGRRGRQGLRLRDRRDDRVRRPRRRTHPRLAGLRHRRRQGGRPRLRGEATPVYKRA